MSVGGCGGHGSSPTTGGASPRLAAVSAPEQQSFLSDCAQRVGSESASAAVCRCALTGLRAETNSTTFKTDVGVWQGSSIGLAFRSLPAQIIARCNGERGLETNGAPVRPASSSGGPSVRNVGDVTPAEAKKFRWPPTRSSVLRSCTEGPAVADGMSCRLADAIARANDAHRDPRKAQLRALRLLDPITGHRVSVLCLDPGRTGGGAVCRAGGEGAALLPAPGMSG